MSQTQILGPSNEVPFTNTTGAPIPGGTPVQLPDGRAAILNRVRPVEDGETATAVTGKRVTLDSDPAAEFAAGADVSWSNADAEANTAGDFVAGKAFAAKAAGVTTVTVIVPF
ncbi:MAG: capsid cement protein [Planctomycetota bacterium]